MSRDYIFMNHVKSEEIFQYHLHDYYEFYFVLSNNVRIETEFEIFNANIGDMFMFAPFSFHRIMPSVTPFERCLLIIKDKVFSERAKFAGEMFSVFQNKRYLHFKPNAEQTKELAVLFDKGTEICRSNYSEADAFFYAFSILRILSKLPSSDTAAQKKPGQISDILKYVYENAEYGVSLKDISEKFGIGQTKLYTVFKDNFGIAPGEYILRLKIMKAIELLQNGATVTEAANYSGFNSYANFIRTFKKKTGFSPHNYKG